MQKVALGILIFFLGCSGIHPNSAIPLLIGQATDFQIPPNINVQPMSESRRYEYPGGINAVGKRSLDEKSVTLENVLSTMFFVGTWQINPTNGSKLFEMFEHQQGKIMMSFNEGFQIEDQLIWYKQPIPAIPIYYIQMQIIDGEYFDNSHEVITIDDLLKSDFDVSSKVLTIIRDNFVIFPYEACNISLRIDFSDVLANSGDSEDTYNTNGTGLIKASVRSLNCKVNFDANMQIGSQDYTTRIVSLTIFHETILFVIFLTNMKLIKRLFKSTAESNRVSVAEPVFIGLWDLVFVTNMHIVSTESTLSLTLILFALNLTMLIFTSILLLVIPMVKRTQSIDTNILISEFLKLICSYGFSPVIAMILILKFSVSMFFHPTFLFLTNLYLLPQIIHNIAKGIPVLFEPHTILYTISLRPLLSFYFKACPSNIYEITPSIPGTIAIVISVGLQIFILFLQAKYGVRFFLPKRILSDEYSYFHDQSEENSAMELIKIIRTCNICLGKLSKSPNLTETPDMEVQSTLDRMDIQPESTMKTECKHKFHAVCLIEWMKEKMECPMCGFVLRPL